MRIITAIALLAASAWALGQSIPPYTLVIPLSSATGLPTGNTFPSLKTDGINALLQTGERVTLCAQNPGYLGDGGFVQMWVRSVAQPAAGTAFGWMTDNSNVYPVWNTGGGSPQCIEVKLRKRADSPGSGPMFFQPVGVNCVMDAGTNNPPAVDSGTGNQVDGGFCGALIVGVDSMVESY